MVASINRVPIIDPKILGTPKKVGKPTGMRPLGFREKGVP